MKINKTSIIPITIVLLAIIIGAYALFLNTKNESSNEKFMYGFSSFDEYLEKRTENQKKIDEDSIKNVLASEGVKNWEEISSKMCEKWIQLISSGDVEKGIKILNQAGILDSQNACTYANYGYYLGLWKNDITNASSMYEKALKLMKWDQKWWININYAEVLDRCFSEDKKRTDCLKKALTLAKESEKEKSDAPKVYFILSKIYIHLQDKENAVKYITLYREKGGNARNWTLLQVMYGTEIK